MSRRLLVAGGAVVVALVVAAAVVIVLARRHDPLPQAEARRFAREWAAASPAVDALAVPGSGAAADQKDFRSRLSIAKATISITSVRRASGGAVAAVHATYVVRGLGEWGVDSSLPFVKKGGRWLADWKPAALHPSAVRGDHFDTTRQWPARAPILGAGGASLTPQVSVVVIGAKPSALTDRAAVAGALQQALGYDPTRLDAALAAPGVQPDHFVPLLTVREDRYRQVRSAIHDLPGLVFDGPKPLRLPYADVFATQTLGTTGEITKELLDKLGPLYRVGDTVGRSGLELAFERQLAGTPSGTVDLVHADGRRDILQKFDGQAPAALTTTLRPDVQLAAEAALDGVTVPAALVAVDVQTGAILAAASRPLTDQFDRALHGHYPPGSTFKIITTDALIAAGGPDQQLSCPAQVVIGGKPFMNFESEALGPLSLRDAFVHSCNTAFAAAASALPDDALVAASARYGFGVKYATSGSEEIGGTFPKPKDAAERAAAAIGQGSVTATPAQMASVAAAATSGTWLAPYLLPDRHSTATATPTPAAIAPLHDFMRGVVTEGTATAAASVTDLIGKTGTAEFGTDNPPKTHAWFVGSRHGVAFAVILEGGGVGGRDAAPLAAKFAATLP